jgi:DNA modification methylase
LKAQLFNGDCLEVLKTLPGDTIGAMVTDPPAGIAFMNQTWDENRGGAAQWIGWMYEVMGQAFRVLKPGAYALVWAIPRTSHWTASALELAGFEIRDIVTHHFGSGFPKNMDIAKAIDKMLGVEPEVVGTAPQGGAKFQLAADTIDNGGFNDPSRREYAITRAASDLAKAWEGWGTALKPASEHWILCRKPPADSIARNIEAYGVGGINIDESRIPLEGEAPPRGTGVASCMFDFHHGVKPEGNTTPEQGRWPANLILTHSQACGLYCADDCPCRVFDEEARYFKRFKWNFIYSPKPAVAEKERGLEESESVIFSIEWREGTWESEAQKVMLQVDTDPSPPKVIAVYGAQNKSASEWSMLLFGSGQTDQFRQDISSTTKTMTSSITKSKILSYLMPLLTSENTQVVEPSGANGLKNAADAGSSNLLVSTTSEKMASLLGAKNAQGPMLLKISAAVGTLKNDGRSTIIDNPYQRGATKRLNTHPTVKSQELMEYLIRMITPPGESVIDPFMGSGSTGVAAIRGGWRFVGIEKEAPFFKIAKTRIDKVNDGQMRIF